MGLKSNRQIILITQGDLRALHFDLRNNNVMTYNHPGSVEQIADALIIAAEAFEADCRLYIESVSRSLSPDATLCLNAYGRLYRDNSFQSLHRGHAKWIFQSHDLAEFRYDYATRELLDRRLIWTDYKVAAVPGGDAYGMHATALGWAFIEHMWRDLRRQSSENT